MKQFLKKEELKVFARKYYYVEKKGNCYAIGHMVQMEALGNRGYLMPIIFDSSIYGLLQTKYFIRQRMLRK